MDKLHQLSAQYNALWIETNQLYEAWARQQGVSLYELLVILSIVETDGTALQKDICQRFAIPKQTISAIIKTLTNKGWLELKVLEQDRRSRKLCLTSEGSARAEQIAQALQEHEAQVWLRLGLERAEQLIEHTALYNRHFKEVSG
ncbi:MAG: MarR family winged helix-turn-helix transcriptional regulator [Dysosmobacter welbionis]|uniref:MarR family winged helix-turn-helix transcriptional regulator n=1 Tax=Dysosmobacter welbionis TaxID=2093857 RepID=UPI00399ACD39